MSKPAIRSSSLPLFMVCTNAVLNPDKIVPVESENEAALGGTLVHDLCEKLVKTGEYDLKPLKQRLPEAEYDRASMLMSNFLVVWREASLVMKKPLTEIAIAVETVRLTLTGTIDAVDWHSFPRTAYILDYKTGRQHENHYHQMAGYAYLVWANQGYQSNYTVHVTTVYLEDLTITNYTFTAAILLEWWDEVIKQLEQPRYTAGRKCAMCSINGGCPGYRNYTAGAIQVFNDENAIPGSVWHDLTPEQRGEIVDRMYVIEKAIGRIKLSLRNTVKQYGNVDVGDGKEFTLVKSTEKSLNAAKALPVLTKRLGAGIVKSLSRIPLDDMLAAYAARAAKGMKTKARQQLFEELDKAGAVVRSDTERMWRRPKGETTLETK